MRKSRGFLAVPGSALATVLSYLLQSMATPAPSGMRRMRPDEETAGYLLGMVPPEGCSVPVTGTLSVVPFSKTRGIRMDDSPSRGTSWSTIWSTAACDGPTSGKQVCPAPQDARLMAVRRLPASADRGVQPSWLHLL